tara:strand:- start:22 stop:378 length:357 start_codon:yes stop_codon:yes gene_type:complete
MEEGGTSLPKSPGSVGKTASAPLSTERSSSRATNPHSPNVRSSSKSAQLPTTPASPKMASIPQEEHVSSKEEIEEAQQARKEVIEEHLHGKHLLRQVVLPPSSWVKMREAHAGRVVHR